jgi:hypothetical protein
MVLYELEKYGCIINSVIYKDYTLNGFLEDCHKFKIDEDFTKELKSSDEIKFISISFVPIEFNEDSILNYTPPLDIIKKNGGAIYHNVGDMYFIDNDKKGLYITAKYHNNKHTGKGNYVHITGIKSLDKMYEIKHSFELMFIDKLMLINDEQITPNKNMNNLIQHELSTYGFNITDVVYIITTEHKKSVVEKHESKKKYLEHREIILNSFVEDLISYDIYYPVMKFIINNNMPKPNYFSVHFKIENKNGLNIKKLFESKGGTVNELENDLLLITQMHVNGVIIQIQKICDMFKYVPSTNSFSIIVMHSLELAIDIRKTVHKLLTESRNNSADKPADKPITDELTPLLDKS